MFQKKATGEVHHQCFRYLSSTMGRVVLCLRPQQWFRCFVGTRIPVTGIFSVLLALVILSNLWLVSKITTTKNDRIINADTHRFIHSHEPSEDNVRILPRLATNSSHLMKGSICHGCLSVMIRSIGKSCGTVMVSSYSFGRSASMQEAGRMVARKFEECSRCDPVSCPENEKIYHRYDRVGPRILTASTLTLESIPSKFRLPPQAVKNITRYFSKRENQYPTRSYFFDYNPSIIQLPEPFHNAVYLASFRVSNQHYCFHPYDRELMLGPNKKIDVPINYLGLALLGKDLEVVSDTVVRTDILGIVEDFRLFNINGTVYLSGNSALVPININQKQRGDQVFPVVFAAQTPGLSQISFRPFVSCISCGRKRPTCGKNINYFEASGGVYGEIWPSAPRHHRQVSLDIPCARRPESEPITSASDVLSSYGTEEETQYFVAEPHHRLLTRGRGGACCLASKHPGSGENIFIGVAHSKTPSQGNRLPQNWNITSNHYLSYFYAFNESQPFDIIAKSGYFCLGFPSRAEVNDFPLPTLTSWRKLRIHHEYECPRIHFVSGIVQDAYNDEYIILAYGINDCFSRFLRVSKSSVLDMLFQPSMLSPSQRL